MPSFDRIKMKKYYQPTHKIIALSTEIGRLLGIVDATHLRKPRTELRNKNKVKSIRASLAIEGNRLTEEQVTAIMENKEVIGSSKEILEVKNAIMVYDQLLQFDPFSEKSYLEAHKNLMSGLIKNPGAYRTSVTTNRDVGVAKDDKVAHLAPPAWNVSQLMKELFNYLINDEDHFIIKSCVFHYEMEFIHPFIDGNGRMGRLWQTLILMQENPVFEFLPIEKEIKESQSEYYNALAKSDKEEKCTIFIEYMLKRIKSNLKELVESQRKSLSSIERIEYFIEYYNKSEFSRKDYLKVFPKISTATATRDLRQGTETGLLKRVGKDRLSKYLIKE